MYPYCVTFHFEGPTKTKQLVAHIIFRDAPIQNGDLKQEKISKQNIGCL